MANNEALSVARLNGSRMAGVRAMAVMKSRIKGISDEEADAIYAALTGGNGGLNKGAKVNDAGVKMLLDLRNDVGLLAEEYDPCERRMLGNFPQAFSHVALVNSGINLMHAHAMMPKRSGRKRPHVVRHRD